MLLKKAFSTFELVHVPREQNSREDLLAKLASSRQGLTEVGDPRDLEVAQDD